MNDRLRGFIRGFLRLLFIGLGLAALSLGWRAFLHYGPGLQGGARAPAMYLFHAKALIRQRMAFPRAVAPVLLPAPQRMSSAEVQLRLMQWWDGQHWLPEALAHGESVKGGLQLHAGELTLVDVTRVTRTEIRDGVTTCAVRAKVRWDFPENLRELHRVREIVDLRFVKGLTPGQVTEMTCTFTRKGWRWELVSAESPWGGKLAVLGQSRSLLDCLF